MLTLDFVTACQIFNALFSYLQAASIASVYCRDDPSKITTSGILPTFLRLIETTMAISCPPDLHPKLSGSNISDITSKSKTNNGKTKSHNITPFHAEFLQCCILSHQYRFAQKYLRSHPVHSHLLLLSSNNAMASNSNHPRFDTTSYLKFHYYSGLIHMKCEDWQSALSSFHLCLTVPCIGNSLNAIGPISVAARKKMLLVRCVLLEAEEMDGPSDGALQDRKVSAGKTKKTTIENTVLKMPGAASQMMCRYMSNPSKRIDDNSEGVDKSSKSGSIPERAGEQGSERGEERTEDYHYMKRKQRHGNNDKDPSLSSGQLKNIRELGQYHDLVSTYITGNPSHFASLLLEMRDGLRSDGNWEVAKYLEGRLVYRAVKGITTTYSVIGMCSLEKQIRDICGASVKDIMGSRKRAEDALAGMALCDWEDVFVSDPFFARMDQKTGVVNFEENEADAVAKEEEDAQWLEYDLSGRMATCIDLAERVRELDVQFTTSSKYQHHAAKWDIKHDVSMTQAQGIADADSSPMDVGADW